MSHYGLGSYCLSNEAVRFVGKTASPSLISSQVKPALSIAIDPIEVYECRMQPPISREALEQYLIDYLREEFMRYPDVRVRRIEEDHEIGISVKTASREYFFPIEWAHRQDFKSVQCLVREVKLGLKDLDV